MQYVTSIERIGRAKGQRELVRNMIRRRFGTVPSALDQRLDTADQDMLEDIADRLITATTVEDLLARS